MASSEYNKQIHKKVVFTCSAGHNFGSGPRIFPKHCQHIEVLFCTNGGQREHAGGTKGKMMLRTAVTRFFQDVQNWKERLQCSFNISLTEYDCGEFMRSKCCCVDLRLLSENNAHLIGLTMGNENRECEF